MSTYVCRRCDHSEATPWEGRCPSCRGLYRAKKVGVDTAEQKNRSTFAAAAASKIDYIATGFKGVDDVLGGGLVAGSVILFGGFRGAGKSTCLVQLADALSSRRKVVYASSEQSAEAVVQIAHRVGARSDAVVVLGNQSRIEATLQSVKTERAFLTIYDSLQKYTSGLSAGVAGSAAQGSAVASAVKADCRERNSCAIVVNQMSRSGELKGGTDVEHDLDTILVLAYPTPADEDAPGNESDGIRMLVGEKNRNGPEALRAYFRMTSDGSLEQVAARSKILDIRAKYRRD